MPAYTTNLSIVRNGSSIKSTSVETEFDNVGVEFDDEAELPANTTNFDIPCSIAYANIGFVYFYCDVALTIKTNSTGSPDQTISLGAGKPLKWATGDADACPITANLTHLYLTNTTVVGEIYLLIGVNL